MKTLLITIFVLFISACSYISGTPQRNVASGDSIEHDLNTKEGKINALKQRREEVRKWVTLCQEAPYAGQISLYPAKCDQFDALEWAGHTCLSAVLAGDVETINDRCRDVELGQDSKGRFWRGQSNINVTTADSFSRDMMTGVISYLIAQGYLSNDETTKQRAKNIALNWMDWIETEGDGKKMCNDGSDNRCSILGSFPLYTVLNKIGAINSANKNYKLVKHFKKKPNFALWFAELLLTPAGYELYLKGTEIYQRYLLGVVSDSQFKKFMKVIYKKDPNNPHYQLMYSGPNKSMVEKTLAVCPTNRLKPEERTLHHHIEADFAWQRDSKIKAWEIANGHDCITLINWQLAILEGKTSLPIQESTSTCDNKKELGTYDEKKICLTKDLIKNIPRTKCTNKNGVFWEANNQEYCLLDKASYFEAKYINKECPTGHTPAGEFKDLPVCHRNVLEKISYHKCISGHGNTIYPQWTDKHEWCYLNKSTWWQRRALGNKCPVGHPFQNEYVWGAWPVCKGLKKISKADCQGYNQPKENYCLVQKDGWFAKREYKSGCPTTMKYIDKNKDGKPLCKALASLKIKESKCSKEGGSKFEGYCIWDKGDHFKSRKLK